MKQKMPEIRVSPSMLDKLASAEAAPKADPIEALLAVVGWPSYEDFFKDQVAVQLIARGRGQLDAWAQADLAWKQRQERKAKK